MATFATHGDLIITKLLLLFLLVTLMHGSDVRGENILDKAILKTIQDKSGDIFDCHLIYKQPSLRHPSMRDHKIQRPSSSLRQLLTKKIEESPFHAALPTVDCPIGTVPIRRTEEFKGTVPFNVPKNHSAGVNTENNEFYAVWVTTEGTYYGAQASMGIWAVDGVKPDQNSGVNMWVGENSRSDVNDLMSIGWLVSLYIPLSSFDDTFGTNITASCLHTSYNKYYCKVSPALYHDNQPRLTLHWTARGKGSCYNTQCPGFVQFNRKIAFGGTFPNISDYDLGVQYFLTVTIAKDPVTHVWYLFVGDDMSEVGYWPNGFFPHLPASAPKVIIGGFTTSPKIEVSPRMGNGKFPQRDVTNSAVKNIWTIDASNRFVNPSPFFKHVIETSYRCYELGSIVNHHDKGISFEYGGPGSC